MRSMLSVKTGWMIAVFVFLDLVCTGLGMGVPIFCILFGFPVGWCIARRATARPSDTRRILLDILRGAALTSAVTFCVMALLWARCVVMLFDPGADLANFGIPMILYQPVASFVGWLVLMIFISPFLQFLMTLFGSNSALLWWLSSTTEERVV